MPDPTQQRDDELEVLAVDPDIVVDLDDELDDDLAPVADGDDAHADDEAVAR